MNMNHVRKNKDNIKNNTGNQGNTGNPSSINADNLHLRAKADYYIEEGSSHYEKGDIDEAIINYRKAAELDVQNQMVHYRLGSIFHEKGMLDEAIKEYQQALDIKSPAANIHYNLGLALYEKGELDDALDEYNIAVALDGENSIYYNNIGLILYEKGMLEDAIEAYEIGLEISPESMILRKNLDRAIAKQKEILKSENKIKLKINFSVVGGLSDVKETLKMAIVYPAKHQDIFKFYKKKISRGIMLYGPPGCGKTYIARAVAGECSAEFFDIKITDIYNKYYGESEKSIHDIFEIARESAGENPSIVFIDEIDAIGSRRDSRLEQFEKRIVNQLLIEISDIEYDNSNVITIVATNTPWNIDPALMRPGRFDKHIFIAPPDLMAREEIFKLNMKDRPIRDVDFKKLAELTENYSAADIVQVCEEAAGIALKEALEKDYENELKNEGNALEHKHEPRNINMDDFLEVLKMRKSSLKAWFNFARQEIAEYGSDESLRELYEMIKKHTENKVEGAYYR